MPTLVAAKPRVLSLLGRALRAVPRWFRASDAPQSTGVPDADTLPSARLRDLGFERDQVGGNIDFAKGQHQRFF